MNLGLFLNLTCPSGVTSLYSKLMAIFSTGTNGFIYDPSDMASLYQDSAGTTPVTAVTNPVGKISDKSGNTNHALQATAAARPTWTNRVNLLTYTEQFDNAVWNHATNTRGVNVAVAPNGSMTADSIIDKSTSELKGVYGAYGGSGSVTVSVYMKAGTRSTAFLGDGNVSYITVNLATGALISNAQGLAYSITDAGSGWWRVSVTYTAYNDIFLGVCNPADNTRTAYVGAGSGDAIYIWGAQLERGSTATTYQRVTTATDFYTAGFPYYLSFLGTDDSLASATGGGGSAGFFWCGAVTPTGGAGTLQTLFADNGTNTGYKVQKDVNNKLSFSAGDNAAFTTKVSTAALSVGTKVMLTVWDDGTNLNVQIGDAAAETVVRPVVVAGTAGYTIAKDNGAASSFYIGNKYPGVYAKDTGLTAAQRATAQAWVKQKAGIV